MAAPTDASRPRFASGCRWGARNEERVVLFPEGMIRVQGTGLSILELCNGERTVAQIIDELGRQFANANPEKIREDVLSFLEALQAKRVVDYE